MAVDNKRLWVFNQRVIACVSHAALKQAVRRKDPQSPTLDLGWARYEPPLELGHPGTIGYYNGLRDLSPCDDGSLYAVFSSGQGIPRMHYCTPSIDEKALKITIQGTRMLPEGVPTLTNGWTMIDEARANRVIKHPIFCWSLLEGLADTLRQRERAVTRAIDVVGT
jgi:hypothetical protein